MTNEQRRDIEKLAYLIWERAGRPRERADDHWLEAEYLVLTGAYGGPADLSLMPPGGG